MEFAAETSPLDDMSFPSIPNGDISGDGNVNIVVVMLGFRILLNQITPTSYQSVHADVAPLVSGNPVPDGKIDVGDIFLIQRKSLGLVSFWTVLYVYTHGCIRARIPYLSAGIPEIQENTCFP